ncbi:hypothetical protein CAPTEDRAFT_185761 [Capitella teleta]|uniref:Uncharacterized protein n=1 Tax=Capitella teleta TaxID=283909 RepID=R7VM61_CAPTE|nr:hypothetical protein CAPTEDRAFT_185761 [Capitella teleta]|eukprot:ELU18280.1 hypothetical protein CAPTEDRAFT_185761 [Capitella teleta]
MYDSMTRMCEELNRHDDVLYKLDRLISESFDRNEAHQDFCMWNDDSGRIRTQNPIDADTEELKDTTGEESDAKIHTMAEVAAMGYENKGFKVLKKQQEKESKTKLEKKRYKKQKTSQGTANNSDQFLSGPKTVKVVLTRAHPDSPVDGLKNYIKTKGKEQNIEDIKVEDLSSPEWETKCFVVSLSAEAQGVVMNTDFWPKGIQFGKWADVLQGRPKGGTAFMYNKDFNNLKLCWRSNSAQSMKQRRWRWATDDHIDAYKCQLDQELGTDLSQGGAFAYNNSSCSDEQHHEDVTKLCDNIFQSCLSSSEKTIPSRRARCPPIAGWKEHVKPLREKSMFWHWLWSSCDKPNFGQVYEVMKMTIKKYHSALKHAKDNQFDMRKRSLASKIEDGVDFWTELQKINPKKDLFLTTLMGEKVPKRSRCNNNYNLQPICQLTKI